MKLTKQDCCEEFREDIRRALGGRVVTGWLGNYEISSEAHSEKVTEEDTEDRTEWRWNIRCGDP